MFDINGHTSRFLFVLLVIFSASSSEAQNVPRMPGMPRIPLPVQQDYAEHLRYILQKNLDAGEAKNASTKLAPWVEATIRRTGDGVLIEYDVYRSSEGHSIYKTTTIGVGKDIISAADDAIKKDRLSSAPPKMLKDQDASFLIFVYLKDGKINHTITPGGLARQAMLDADLRVTDYYLEIQKKEAERVNAQKQAERWRTERPDLFAVSVGQKLKERARNRESEIWAQKEQRNPINRTDNTDSGNGDPPLKFWSLLEGHSSGGAAPVKEPAEREIRIYDGMPDVRFRNK